MVSGGVRLRLRGFVSDEGAEHLVCVELPGVIGDRDSQSGLTGFFSSHARSMVSAIAAVRM
jgi:hypothetical protein